MTRPSLLLLAATLAACGSIKPNENNTTTDGGSTDTTPLITIVDEGSGVHTAVVDAHDETKWSFLDLDTSQPVSPADSAHDTVWDLSFQRFLIRTNSGTSGSGGGEAARLEGVGFADVTTAPASGYVADNEAMGESETGPAYAFLVGDGWYSYDIATHQLSARAVVYVVKTPEGHYFKVQVLGYYDGTGNPAHLSLKWASVAAPATNSDQLVLDASSSTDWAYLRLSAGGTAEAGDTAHWDVAFKGVSIRTNSGTSGAGFGGARVSTDAFETISSATTFGYAIDEEQPVAGPPGSGTVSASPVLGDWYNYDGATHQVSAKGTVWLVRTAAGGYAKLQITAFDQATHKFAVRYAPVSRHVETLTLTVDASVSTTWTAVSLRDGAIVAVTNLATSKAWDFAFSRTLARTNGGSSGPGNAGALDSGTATFANLLTAPATGYVVDAVAPLPGPPGAGEASGNAVLGDWYNYDATTHAVSPKATTYAMRAADGSYAKLQITGWSSGILTITIAYAGPGAGEF